MAATSNETPNNQTWYLDTGCTNHMCGKKELFAYFAQKWNSVMGGSFQWLEKGEFLSHWRMVITGTSMMFSMYLIWKVICWVCDS